MESSIKKSYDRIVQSDGTVLITYKARRVDSHQATGAIIFLTLPLLFVALMILGGVYGLTNSIPVACVAAGGFLFFVIRLITSRRVYSLVLTKEGVIFPRSSWGSSTHQLRYDDISNIGVNRKSSSGNGQYVESCNVYAFAGGSEVQLSRFVTQSLADALADEVVNRINSSKVVAA